MGPQVPEGERPIAVAWGRDAVSVHGPDAERYLQGQLSQDVSKLALGASAWTLVLQPQGKLDVFARLTRLADDRFLLDSDAGTGGALATRLQRFLLRTKAVVEQMPGWGALAVRSPLGAPTVAGPGAPTGPGDAGAQQAAAGGSYALVVPSALPEGCTVAGFSWNGWRGYDILGPEGALPTGSELGDGVVLALPEELELARVLAGFPRHGSELDSSTIPAEAHLVGESVSFTKGCYTGQELVARVDSRGNNVPRRLYGLAFSAAGAPAPGDVLTRAGVEGSAGAEGSARAEGSAGAESQGAAAGGVPAAKPVGRVTSVAISPSGRWFGLGYAVRSATAGDVLVVAGGADGLQAQLLSLPMSPA
ncbi:MAG TPA: hypothetical protein VFN61_14470 [Acidimicrobiales bacterium]|nr:hypothetical protein [Acidimicrobiales bacterium]